MNKKNAAKMIAVPPQAWVQRKRLEKMDFIFFILLIFLCDWLWMESILCVFAGVRLLVAKVMDIVSGCFFVFLQEKEEITHALCTITTVERNCFQHPACWFFSIPLCAAAIYTIWSMVRILSALYRQALFIRRPLSLTKCRISAMKYVWK